MDLHDVKYYSLGGIDESEPDEMSDEADLCRLCCARIWRPRTPAKDKDLAWDSLIMGAPPSSRERIYVGRGTYLSADEHRDWHTI